ncbi:MAG: hypothetical protein QME51_00380 [Planctomycetota bacterium]|nr:hypothetical protein [Planctomycetota bacterium]MDI6786816.1 hypothetical protein [Planctomycetota bacterium]
MVQRVQGFKSSRGAFSTYLLPSVIVLFWLIMTTLFILREVLPSLPALTQPSYAAYLKKSDYEKEIKMGVYLMQERIGSSTTTITPMADKTTVISNFTTLKVLSFLKGLLTDTSDQHKRRAGRKQTSRGYSVPAAPKDEPPAPQGEARQRRRHRREADPPSADKLSKVDVGANGATVSPPMDIKGTNLLAVSEANLSIELSGRSVIDENYRLKEFHFTVKSPILNYIIEGKVEDNLLKFTISDGKKTTSQILPYVPTSTLSDGLSPFISMPHLSVGKEWAINSINPFGGCMQTLKAKVENLTTIEWKGENHDVYEVILSDPSLPKHSLNYTAYITPDGRILKQEILMPGFYIIRE